MRNRQLRLVASLLTLLLAFGSTPAHALRTQAKQEQTGQGAGLGEIVTALGGLEEGAVFQQIQSALAKPFPMESFPVRVEGASNRDAGVWVEYRGVGGFVPNRLLLHPSGRPLTASEKGGWLWNNEQTEISAYPVEISQRGYRKTQRPLLFSIVVFPEEFRLGAKRVQSTPQVEALRKLIEVPALFWILVDRFKHGSGVQPFLERLWHQRVDPRPWILDRQSRIEEWEEILQGVRLKMVSWVVDRHWPSQHTGELFGFFHSVATRRSNTAWADLPVTRAAAVLGMRRRATSPENVPRRHQMEVEAFQQIVPLWEESEQLPGPHGQSIQSILITVARGMTLPEADQWLRQVSTAGLEEGETEKLVGALAAHGLTASLPWHKDDPLLSEEWPQVPEVVVRGSREGLAAFLEGTPLLRVELDQDSEGPLIRFRNHELAEWLATLPHRRFSLSAGLEELVSELGSRVDPAVEWVQPMRILVDTNQVGPDPGDSRVLRLAELAVRLRLERNLPVEVAGLATLEELAAGLEQLPDEVNRDLLRSRIFVYQAGDPESHETARMLLEVTFPEFEGVKPITTVDEGTVQWFLAGLEELGVPPESFTPEFREQIKSFLTLAPAA